MRKFGGFMRSNSGLFLAVAITCSNLAHAEDVCISASGVQAAPRNWLLPPSPTIKFDPMRIPTQSEIKYRECLNKPENANYRLSVREMICSGLKPKQSAFGNTLPVQAPKTVTPSIVSDRRCPFNATLTSRDYLINNCHSPDGRWVGENDPQCGRLSKTPTGFDHKSQVLERISFHAKEECRDGAGKITHVSELECKKTPGSVYTSKESVIKREKEKHELNAYSAKKRNDEHNERTALNSNKNISQEAFNLAKDAHDHNLQQLSDAKTALKKNEKTLKETNKKLSEKTTEINALEEKRLKEGLSTEEQTKLDGLLTEQRDLQKEIGDENTGLIHEIAENKKTINKEENEIGGPDGSKAKLKTAEKNKDKADDSYDESFGDSDAIQEKNENKDYGGKYGGASVNTSIAIEAASQQASGAMTTLGANKVQKSAQDREASLRQQPVSNLNIEDVNAARKETANDAKTALTVSGLLEMGLGVYQGIRAFQHVKSKEEVEETADKARRNTVEGKGDAQEIENNIKNNLAGEKLAQDEAFARTGAASIGFLTKGIAKLSEAKTIEAIEAQAGPGKQYGITLGSGVLQGEGSDGVNTLTPIQAAVTTEEEQKKEELAQNAPINPTDPNMIPGGPAAAPFEYQNPSTSGAGAGGGPGMAGGTSADRSAMEAGAQGPAAVTKAGSYAAVAGGGGYKAKNAGGAGKAGVDTAFADLLKKFLPGAEPEKKKSAGELQFGDRSPASSQTAVIGRNKNIFEEISKRYQKKSAEGSVF
jgi:hypothetical protein